MVKAGEIELQHIKLAYTRRARKQNIGNQQAGQKTRTWSETSGEAQTSQHAREINEWPNKQDKQAGQLPVGQEENQDQRKLPLCGAERMQGSQVHQKNKRLWAPCLAPLGSWDG